MRCTALRALLRETKDSRSRHEDDPKSEDRGTRLSLLRDGHGEADIARDSVPGTQERGDAIRAHRCEDDIISMTDIHSDTSRFDYLGTL
eukprot:3436525-Pleurochrysis_carterae.AAC.5